MLEKSLVDYAYDVLSKRKGEIHFKALFEEVVNATGLSEDEADARISLFYTNLTLDGRFITLPNNHWDLRDRHTYNEAHIDLNIYTEEDTPSVDAETELENGSDEEEVVTEEEEEFDEVASESEIF